MALVCYRNGAFQVRLGVVESARATRVRVSKVRVWAKLRYDHPAYVTALQYDGIRCDGMMAYGVTVCRHYGITV